MSLYQLTKNMFHRKSSTSVGGKTRVFHGHKIPEKIINPNASKQESTNDAYSSLPLFFVSRQTLLFKIEEFINPNPSPAVTGRCYVKTMFEIR